MMSGDSRRIKALIEIKFNRLRDQWKSESARAANFYALTLTQVYKNIIALGEPAVPYILKDLKEEFDHLALALDAPVTPCIIENLKRDLDHWSRILQVITKENPVPEECEDNLVAIADAWLKWGNASGFISHQPPPDIEPTGARLEKLRECLASRDDANDILDDLVYEIYGEMASAINNGGLEAQLEFVREYLGDEVTEFAIVELLENPDA